MDGVSEVTRCRSAARRKAPTAPSIAASAFLSLLALGARCAARRPSRSSPRCQSPDRLRIFSMTSTAWSRSAADITVRPALRMRFLAASMPAAFANPHSLGVGLHPHELPPPICRRVYALRSGRQAAIVRPSRLSSAGGESGPPSAGNQHLANHLVLRRQSARFCARASAPRASTSIYLDPPFNSNATYNVLFRGPSGHAKPGADRGVRRHLALEQRRREGLRRGDVRARTPTSPKMLRAIGCSSRTTT